MAISSVRIGESVADAMVKFATGLTEPWRGTATKLYETVSEDHDLDDLNWPQNVISFAAHVVIQSMGDDEDMRNLTLVKQRTGKGVVWTVYPYTPPPREPEGDEDEDDLEEIPASPVEATGPPDPMDW
jgi:hypothetical protein